MKLMLISNSYTYGQGYLDHCMQDISLFIGKVNSILFIPYALHKWDEYTNLVRNRFKKIDVNIDSIHSQSDPKKAISKADAIFVGGGNSFRLLKMLYDLDLLSCLREKVLGGVPYIGTSAGANIACPTIMTTNDMPIVYPSSLEALNLIPFQINPHYIDSDSNCKAMIESRDTRLKEYHEENDAIVIALREYCFIQIEGKTAILKGEKCAKLFIKGKSPKNLAPLTDIGFLLFDT